MRSPSRSHCPRQPTDAEAPSLLLDFGREVSGRLLVESACNCDATLSIAYGESEIEAMSTGLTPGQRGGNYLGTNLLDVPAQWHRTRPQVRLPLCPHLAFLRGAPVTAFKSIRLEGIYYPVTYAGSFESSDPLLNRIWETGAYTAHLCMQDGIWDAPKRDRGRWAGDLDVEGRVISTVFADYVLTRRHAPPPRRGTPASPHVNGIPGYTALWITTLYNLNLHSGDKAFLASQHDTLLRLLGGMDTRLDSDTACSQQPRKAGSSSTGLPASTAELPTRASAPTCNTSALTSTRRSFFASWATPPTPTYETLTRKSHGRRSPGRVSRTTDTLRQQPGSSTRSRCSPSLPAHDDAIWNNVLSHVKQDAPTDPVISPYFNAYVLDAMAAHGHAREALDWIRKYWGGMLAEGATSFWETYDLRWPKTNFHLSLQADGTSGYFVSLAHGWSSGPTAWLTENVLGSRRPRARLRHRRHPPPSARSRLGTRHRPHASRHHQNQHRQAEGNHARSPRRYPPGPHPDRRPHATGLRERQPSTSPRAGSIVLTSPGQYRISGRSLPQ